MKISVEWIVDSLLLTFFILVGFGIIHVTVQINQAYQYHHYVVAKIEESHFDPKVMEELANHQLYTITYTNQSSNHDLELYPKEKLYQIETTYPLELPIIHYRTENTILSFAR